MKRLAVTLAAALMATVLAAPAVAQDIQTAADASTVLDNQAKGITNGQQLTSPIRGSSIQTPIKTTGYFGLAPAGEFFIGTLGTGSGTGCPFVNAYRSSDTYRPGDMFRVDSCGYPGGGVTYVGVRVYGVICSVDSPANCQHLGQALSDPEQYETGGYVALLKPERECSQPKWPTDALRRAGAPAYAEWCDYGVRIE